MPSRIEYKKVVPGAYRAMLSLEKHLHDCDLETSLLDLIRVRASQINGCAFCLDMHSKDARAAGETEQRLYLLEAWRETPFYSERERAALAWTEVLYGPVRMTDEQRKQHLAAYAARLQRIDQESPVDVGIY